MDFSLLDLFRGVSILIFTVHNVKKESEGQTYAEIVQRAVVLQNAFTAVFELMGHILEICVQLCDPSSSFLLPGILVFVEWKRSFGTDGHKEKGACVKRIVAAGKALANVIKVEQKAVYFDLKAKKFVIGFEPQVQNDFVSTSYMGMATENDNLQENQAENTMKLGVSYPKPELTTEGDEEAEVIVLKPIVAEKLPDVVNTTWASYEGLEPGKNASPGDLKVNGTYVAASFDNLQHETAFSASSQIPVSVANGIAQHLRSIQSHASKLSMEAGFGASSQLPVSIANTSEPVAVQQPVNGSTSGMVYSHTKAPEAMLPFKVDAISSSRAIADGSTVKTSSNVPTCIRKNPVSRPVRHLGPPPGFSPVPPEKVNESIYCSDSMSENLLMDDYSWLDGYQMSSSTKGNGLSSSINFSSHSKANRFTNSNGLSGPVTFPFLSKQGPPMQLQGEKQKIWQDFQMLNDIVLHHEMQLQQQLLVNGNQHSIPQPEQYQGQSVWTGRYFV
ncbi:PREDICTED: SMG7 [Prunus dulcis]|uniref:PREDICTED: SMG7 n=1 Tax=Prunus dulcis TaxID=3755 RepID=A0A5E4FMG1_PRUDU|nr:PREDICTED: SMG7 [Prunus dulcis]